MASLRYTLPGAIIAKGGLLLLHGMISVGEVCVRIDIRAMIARKYLACLALDDQAGILSASKL